MYASKNKTPVAYHRNILDQLRPMKRPKFYPELVEGVTLSGVEGFEAGQLCAHNLPSRFSLAGARCNRGYARRAGILTALFFFHSGHQVNNQYYNRYGYEYAYTHSRFKYSFNSSTTRK
jgi:hypothetical protein